MKALLAALVASLGAVIAGVSLAPPAPATALVCVSTGDLSVLNHDQGTYGGCVNPWEKPSP